MYLHLLLSCFFFIVFLLCYTFVVSWAWLFMIQKKTEQIKIQGNGLFSGLHMQWCLTGYVQSPGVITDWYVACTTFATSGTKDELWGPHVSQPMLPDLQPHSMCSFTPILWRCGQLWCKFCDNKSRTMISLCIHLGLDIAVCLFCWSCHLYMQMYNVPINPTKVSPTGVMG